MKISKLEHGTQAPSEQDIRAWCCAWAPKVKYQIPSPRCVPSSRCPSSGSATCAPDLNVRKPRLFHSTSEQIIPRLREPSRERSSCASKICPDSAIGGIWESGPRADSTGTHRVPTNVTPRSLTTACYRLPVRVPAGSTRSPRDRDRSRSHRLGCTRGGSTRHDLSGRSGGPRARHRGAQHAGMAFRPGQSRRVVAGDRRKRDRVVVPRAWSGERVGSPHRRPNNLQCRCCRMTPVDDATGDGRWANVRVSLPAEAFTAGLPLDRP
jgi:hypothetical protein